MLVLLPGARPSNVMENHQLAKVLDDTKIGQTGRNRHRWLRSGVGVDVQAPRFRSVLYPSCSTIASISIHGSNLGFS
jgi:hypothetical protein